MIGNLREENRDTKISIFGNMDICEDVIFKAKIMKRKKMPLHKQGRNLFGKKKSLQEEIRALQEDNKTLYEDLKKTKIRIFQKELEYLGRISSFEVKLSLSKTLILINRFIRV